MQTKTRGSVFLWACTCTYIQTYVETFSDTTSLIDAILKLYNLPKLTSTNNMK